MRTEDVIGDPIDHPSRRPFKFIRETLGYPIDAFIFVQDVMRMVSMRAKTAPTPVRHVTATELCEAVRRFAIDYFGSEAEARAVFLDWNIRQSDDIGRIVQAMVRGGMLVAHSDDSPEQFDGLFDVEQWLRESQS